MLYVFCIKLLYYAKGNKIQYTRYLEDDGLKEVHLDVLRALIDTASLDIEVQNRTEEAIADLQKSGAVIIDPFEISAFDK